MEEKHIKLGGYILRDGKKTLFNVMGFRKSKVDKGIELEFIYGDKDHPDPKKVELIYIPENMAKTMVKIVSEKLIDKKDE